MEDDNFFDQYEWYENHLGECPNPDQNAEWAELVETWHQFQTSFKEMKGGPELLALDEHWSWASEDNQWYWLGESLPAERYQPLPELTLGYECYGVGHFDIYGAKDTDGRLISLVLCKEEVKTPAGLHMDEKQRLAIEQEERIQALIDTPPAQIWAVTLLMGPVSCAAIENKEASLTWGIVRQPGSNTSENPEGVPSAQGGANPEATEAPSVGSEKFHRFAYVGPHRSEELEAFIDLPTEELNQLLQDIENNHFLFDSHAGGLLYYFGRGLRLYQDGPIDEDRLFDDQVTLKESTPVWLEEKLHISCVFHIALRPNQVQQQDPLVKAIRNNMDNVMADHWGMQWYETSSGHYSFHLSDKALSVTATLLTGSLP